MSDLDTFKRGTLGLALNEAYRGLHPVRKGLKPIKTKFTPDKLEREGKRVLKHAKVDKAPHGSMLGSGLNKKDTLVRLGAVSHALREVKKAGAHGKKAVQAAGRLLFTSLHDKGKAPTRDQEHAAATLALTMPTIDKKVRESARMAYKAMPAKERAAVGKVAKSHMSRALSSKAKQQMQRGAGLGGSAEKRAVLATALGSGVAGLGTLLHWTPYKDLAMPLQAVGGVVATGGKTSSMIMAQNRAEKMAKKAEKAQEEAKAERAADRARMEQERKKAKYEAKVRAKKQREAMKRAQHAKLRDAINRSY